MIIVESNPFSLANYFIVLFFPHLFGPYRTKISVSFLLLNLLNLKFKSNKNFSSDPVQFYSILSNEIIISFEKPIIKINKSLLKNLRLKLN